MALPNYYNAMSPPSQTDRFNGGGQDYAPPTVNSYAPPDYNSFGNVFTQGDSGSGGAPGASPAAPPDSFSAPYSGGLDFSAQKYNPSQYATLDTAANYANWMGGTVNQTVPVGPIAPPPQYGLQFGTGINGNNGETLNAGLVADSWQKAQGLYNDPAVALKQFNDQRAAELAYSHTPYNPATAVQSPAQNGKPANYGGPPAIPGQVPQWNVYDPLRPTTVANPNPQAVAYPKTGGNPYAPGYTPPPAGTPFDPQFPDYTPYGGKAPTGPSFTPGSSANPNTGFSAGVTNGLYGSPIGSGPSGGTVGGPDSYLADFANNTGYLENYAKNAGYQTDPSFMGALNGTATANPFAHTVGAAASGDGFAVNTSGYAINGQNKAWDAGNQYNPSVAATGVNGDSIDQLPAWEAMKKAQERNIRQRGADLQEKFNVMGGRFSTSFGNAYTDFENQAALDQNSQLTAAVAAAQEAAMGRKLSANTFLSGQEQARLNARAGDVTQRDTTAGGFAANAADAAAGRRLSAGTTMANIGQADVAAGLDKAKTQASLGLQADTSARDRELQAADALAKMGFAGAGQLSGQDFQAWQQEQQAAAAAAQAAAQGSDAASRSIADTAAAAGNAMYGTSVDAAKTLSANENAAAKAMFDQQNASYQQLMQYDPAIRNTDINAASTLSGLNTNNIKTGAELGAQQFGVDSFNLDRLFQEYLRRQPENSPLLPYLASLSTAQPVMYQPQYKPSAFSEYAGAISGLVTAGAKAAAV